MASITADDLREFIEGTAITQEQVNREAREWEKQYLATHRPADNGEGSSNALFTTRS